MVKHICKAKRIDNVEWVYGYYAKVSHYLDDSIIHVIIPTDEVLYPHCEFQELHIINPNTVCRYTETTEFVMADKSICSPLFEGDIVEVHSVRCPYAAYPQSKYDGPVKARAVIHFKRGQWQLDYDNGYNNKMCEPRGNEQYERSVSNSWELYYFGYHGKPEHEDEHRRMNHRCHYHDIIKLGNIYDNPELLEG